MGVLRTKEAQAIYEKHVADGMLDDGCPICKAEPIKSFQLWKIINNDFPYNLIAKTHHMLVPLRHVDESGLSEDERKELIDIKNYHVHQFYEFIIESTKKKKSIPAHFHLHLLTIK